MRTIDKFERVAVLAQWAKEGTSGYTVAKVATRLQTLATTHKRLCLVAINGPEGKERMNPEQVSLEMETAKKKRLRTLDKARKVAGELGLTVDETDNGMGYLEVYRPGNDATPIVVF